MANKVIVRSKKVEEINSSESLTELRRLNAKLQHEDIPEDELAHFGVMGMKWGVRKDTSGSSGSGKVSGLKRVANKIFYNKEDEKNWQDATKGMSGIKKFGIEATLGRYWGAKAINKAKAKNADPKEIVKKETKALRKKIASDFGKKSDAELAAHEAEFKAKYPKETARAEFKRFLTSKEGRAKNVEMANVYSDMLTKRMEKMLNEVAADNLAGTKYKIKSVQGFNDWLPDFEITADD
jgi:hypothetical protein